MVKLRHGIENLMWLVRHPNMQLTFEGAQAANAHRNLIEWVEAPPIHHSRFNVDLRAGNRDGIWRMYDRVFKSLSADQKKSYASTQEVWHMIRNGVQEMEKSHYPGGDARHPKPTAGGVFSFGPGIRNQHCEGKLLRHVIENNLLGKVFPYIGCSKRCCEPCFTVITAVNTIIQKHFGPDQCFVVADTHRKVYAGFGITPIRDVKFTGVIAEFNKLLCLDIGAVVKAGVKKGFGDSDSAPEPETPAE